MKSSDRKYGVPFFKITIPFMNDFGEEIGHCHIRATTDVPFKVMGTKERPNMHLFFRDIDGDIHECTDYTLHGPATEKEVNEPYG